MNRITKRESLETVDLIGSVDEVIQRLQDLVHKYSEHGYFEFYLDEEDYYSDYTQHYLCGMRQETDEEYKKRMSIVARAEAKIKKALLSKEIKERKEYERLKKKFEK